MAELPPAERLPKLRVQPATGPHTTQYQLDQLAAAVQSVHMRTSHDVGGIASATSASALSDRCVQLEVDNGFLREEVGNLKRDVSRLHATIDALQTRNRTLTTALYNLSTELRALAATVRQQRAGQADHQIASSKLLYPLGRIGSVVDKSDVLQAHLHAMSWKPKFPLVADAARIFVFGLCGSGVSTLINNLTSLFNETYEAVAAASRSNDRVTTNNTLITTHAKPEIKFLDSVSLSVSRDDYSNGVLKAIVTGELPHNFSVLTGDVAQALQEAEDSGIPATEREMHAAIVAISYGVRDENDKVKSVLRTHIHELNDLHPIIVITNVDQITSPEELAILSDQFERMTGIEKKRIFLLNNRPMENDEPGFLHQCKTLYEILMATLNTADLNHRKLNDERSTKRKKIAPASSVASSLNS